MIKNKLLDEINSADGLLFGTPTINSDMLEPIRDLLTHLNPIIHGGKVGRSLWFLWMEWRGCS